ncbi:MAG: hypothetical protein V4760_06285 [Bdellovibrionota bacterium]
MSPNSIHTIMSTSSDPSLFQIARIVRLTIASPALILDVLEGLRSKEIKVAMYCAEALEKISRAKAQLLSGYETEILVNLSVSTWSEVRGPLALIVPRLTLTDALKNNAIKVLFDFLNDESTILRERVYSALAQVSATDVGVMEKMVPLLTSRLALSDQAERIKAKNLLALISASPGSLRRGIQEPVQQ